MNVEHLSSFRVGIYWWKYQFVFHDNRAGIPFIDRYDEMDKKPNPLC